MLIILVNQARAIRVAEIMSDFRDIQHYLVSIRANPSAQEYYEEGYAVLRQCASEAHALLGQPFDMQAPGPQGSEEQGMIQLRQSVHDPLLCFSLQTLTISQNIA